MREGLKRYDYFIAKGQQGTVESVDFLMAALVEENTLATTKLVDYALSLVDSPAGRMRIRHFLFRGDPVQRNYAALYFKRRKHTDVLHDAVEAGAIDMEQAFLQ